MLAKFPGYCTCGAPFLRGDPITYDRKLRRVTACPACLDPDVTGGGAYDHDAAMERLASDAYEARERY